MSCTHVLESGKNILADAVLVELGLHGGDDIVDNGAIDMGLKEASTSPDHPLLDMGIYCSSPQFYST